MNESGKDGPSEEDLEEARHREVLAHLAHNREKSAQEHGAIVGVVRSENEATRSHIGSEVETMRADVSHIKNFMGRLLRAMKRFLERHGIGTDDL